MVDFKDIKLKVELTADFILNKVSDSEILYYYHGRFKLNDRISHPFRRDKQPSATFFLSKRGQICLYDFVDGSVLNCFHYVKKLYNCDFNKALHIIAKDFGLIDKSTTIVTQEQRKKALEIERESKKETLIQFTYKKYTNEALKFWNLYEITKDELQYDEVYQVDKLWLNKVEITNNYGFLRFAKIEEFDGTTGVKIYSPEDTNMKWLSSIPLDVPYSLNKLKFQSDTIVITKSFKDGIVLRKIFTDVISLQSENKSALSQKTIDFVNSNYEKKILIFDSDLPGINALNNFTHLNWTLFHFPIKLYEKYNLKDASDICKSFGIEYVKELLTFKS